MEAAHLSSEALHRARSRPLLTVVTVNHNTANFVELLLFALHELTYHDYACLIVDNDSRPEDYDRLKRIVARYPNARLERKHGLEVLGDLAAADRPRGILSRARLQLLRPLAGNLAHGSALNELCPRIDTRYGVIVDSDCIFLKRHWDKELIDRLESAGAAVIGAADPEEPHEPFPTVRCMLFRAAVVQDLRVDFRPLKSVYLDRNPELKRKLRRRFAEYRNDFDERRTSLDVGWDLRRKCQGQRVPWLAIPPRAANGRLAGFEGTETFHHGETLLAAHFGRAAWPLAWKNRPRSSLLKLLYLCSLILPLRRRRKDDRDKERWLARCRAIVEEEARGPA